MKLEHIHAAVLAPESSLNKHFWMLFSVAYGLQAKQVFEFGAGGSSAVLLTALDLTGGQLISCDLEPMDSLLHRTPALREVVPTPRWSFWNVPSSEVIGRLTGEAFELVVHDGSHEPDQVRQDIGGIVPRLKQYGILLVHDVEQFELGSGMRTALMEGIADTGLQVSMTSLPYSDGLAIVRMESDTGHGQVASRWCKSTTRPAVPAALPWNAGEDRELAVAAEQRGEH